MLTLRSNTTSIITRIAERFKNIQPGGEVYDAALHEGANTLLKDCVERIHSNGMAGDGSDIGQYSETPMYINPKNSPTSFSAIGKTGKTLFASTGQPHLTRYFDQGYKDFRQQAGLTSDKVVLVLRGDLRDGLSVMQTSGHYALGWASEELYELSQVLEKKYAKPIWSATPEERIALIQGIQNKVSEAVK